jgi:hypothetical protein
VSLFLVIAGWPGSRWPVVAGWAAARWPAGSVL